MKKIFTNYRFYVLLILFVAATLGIMAVPADDLPMTTWTYCLVSSKIIGFTAAYILCRLFKRWEDRGTIVEIIDLIENF